MITIIAQSHRIARNISFVLQADIEMNGYFANDKYFITWTYGHMVEINTPRGNTGYWFHDSSFLNESNTLLKEVSHDLQLPCSSALCSLRMLTPLGFRMYW